MPDEDEALRKAEGVSEQKPDWADEFNRRFFYEEPDGFGGTVHVPLSSPELYWVMVEFIQAALREAVADKTQRLMDLVSAISVTSYIGELYTTTPGSGWKHSSGPLSGSG